MLLTMLEKVMREKDDFGGNLILNECPTLAHYQLTSKLVSFKWGLEQKKALPLHQII